MSRVPDEQHDSSSAPLVHETRPNIAASVKGISKSFKKTRVLEDVTSMLPKANRWSCWGHQAAAKLQSCASSPA